MSLPFVELSKEKEKNSFFHFWYKLSLSPMYLLHSLIHRSRCHHRLLLLFLSRRVKKRINEKKKFTKIILLFLLDAIRSYGSHTHHQCRHYWRQSFHSDDDNSQVFICNVLFYFVGQKFKKAPNFLHEKFLLLTFSFQFTRWGKFVVQALFLFIVIQPSKTSLIFCWQRWWKIM